MYGKSWYEFMLSPLFRTSGGGRKKNCKRDTSSSVCLTPKPHPHLSFSRPLVPSSPVGPGAWVDEDWFWKGRDPDVVCLELEWYQHHPNEGSVWCRSTCQGTLNPLLNTLNGSSCPDTVKIFYTTFCVMKEKYRCVTLGVPKLCRMFVTTT